MGYAKKIDKIVMDGCYCIFDSRTCFMRMKYFFLAYLFALQFVYPEDYDFNLDEKSEQNTTTLKKRAKIR